MKSFPLVTASSQLAQCGASRVATLLREAWQKDNAILLWHHETLALTEAGG
jgi:hypothetical protein